MSAAQTDFVPLSARPNLSALAEEFAGIWRSKPFKNTYGGMMLERTFCLWYSLRTLPVEHYVESGVFTGRLTWFAEREVDGEIYCIDPNVDDARSYQYRSGRAWYSKGDLLSRSRWRLAPNTMVLLDDHQDPLPRLRFCKEIGAQWVALDDNYPCEDRKDFVSLWQSMKAGECDVPMKLYHEFENPLGVAESAKALSGLGERDGDLFALCNPTLVEL